MTDGGTPPRGSTARAEHEGGPEEEPGSPAPSPHTGQGRKPGWDGPTYYGRSQLKPAPFNNWIVGGYVFVAGLSGSAALLSKIAETVGGRRAAPLARRGRFWSTLAPIVGAPLLIWDLHTPKRFYNMLRVAKPRSPMSIGTWILMAFSLSALPAAAAEALAGSRRAGWLKTAARVAHAPAAASGAGLSTYTAALLSATSTPTWAAAPRALAVRFAASSVSTGASALLLGERDADLRAGLQIVAAAALAVELGAIAVQERAFQAKGVDEAMASRWGRIEAAATALTVAAPLAAFGLSLALGRRRARPELAAAAALATMAGGLIMRVALMSVGDESASRPEVSFRFSQPENLPV